MQQYPEVAVLRLGHRPGRDERMTTHVGLTARALGADRVVLAGDGASRADTVRDITDRFGGPFETETTEEWRALLRDWEGAIVHLTMYGERVQDVEADIRERHQERRDPLLVDRLFDGEELDREWGAADKAVIPQATGKKVVDADGATGEDVAGPD